jgi:predicted transposase YbfD/YdcC
MKKNDELKNINEIEFLVDKDIPLFDFFNRIKDPRKVKNRCKHKLSDILIITICSFLSSVESWQEVELFAKSREKWFKKYLELPGGIPSHDTFLRVFKLIDPALFEKVFFEWIQSVLTHQKDDQICIDGKTVNGTCRSIRSEEKKVLALVNVWSTQRGICLGQMQTNATGSSELKTIKEIFKYLSIEGTIVTVDAASGTTSFTDEIRSRNADYIIPIRQSKKKISMELENTFKNEDLNTHTYVEELKHKGRTERRSISVVKDLNQVSSIQGLSKFKDVNTVAMITYERESRDNRLIECEVIGENQKKWRPIKSKTRKSTKTKFYLSSLNLSAEELLERTKKHWEIENKLHWCLDVNFKEDSNKTREKKAARNMSLIRKLALNLVRKENTFNASLNLKMKKCLYSEEYLERVLFKTSFG